jgi:hypothetical protein
LFKKDETVGAMSSSGFSVSNNRKYHVVQQMTVVGTILKVWLLRLFMYKDLSQQPPAINDVVTFEC